MKCQLLMSGHELMTGVTIDSNSAWIAATLDNIGIQVHKIVTVDDRLQDLAHEINAASESSNLLIINGGLGPTDDDLTLQALAQLIGEPLEVNPGAEQHVLNWCKQRGIFPNQANLKQALLPPSARIIPNASGSAVGACLTRGNCLILCTPGIPSEMKQMMSEEIIPELLQKFPDCRQRFTKRLQIFGMGESSIQHKVHNEMSDWPKEIGLGFRAGFPTLEVKITANSRSDIHKRDHCEQLLRSSLSDVIFGEGDCSLSDAVVQLLQKHQKKITVAESCTGGLIASQLTGIPGASDIFEAGFITYSNRIKESILNVSSATLSEFGAVSEETVLEMARGALEQSGADYVIATSGIAGPSGGTPEKPVGTVWIAWGAIDRIKAHKFLLTVERKQFQQLVSAYGLDLIRREIMGITEKPRYFR